MRCRLVGGAGGCRPTDSQGREREGQSGQALLELSLFVLILFVLFAGIFEFGRAYAASTTVTRATREGARLAMEGGSDAAIVAATNAAAGLFTLEDVDVDRSTANRVKVTATHRFVALLPLISDFWGGGDRILQYTSIARKG